MLHAVHSPRSSPYRVPWRIDRVHGTHPLVTNVGDDHTDFVRVFIDVDDAVRDTQFWGHLAPGETIELCLCDHDPAATVVTLAWFRRSDGAEYVWRFVL